MLRIKDLLNPFTKVRIRDLLNPIEESERPGPSNQEGRPKKCSHCSHPAAKHRNRCEKCLAIAARCGARRREIHKQEGRCSRCPARLDRQRTYAGISFEEGKSSQWKGLDVLSVAVCYSRL
ncbi:hypothetical protein HYE67_008156 [Fusarium culmorum]|uniref:Uncharacterized protein n=1 Tax=Fusarium culmorum TaxID=5516 RepID=A0A2T4H9H3_FUSCU|nr:hypothetical protein FCULG_00002833 [Fusarium culmorum]QPC65925.1 hypothetical protein HYE67_008156 [Fusarium culmorum]